MINEDEILANILLRFFDPGVGGAGYISLEEDDLLIDASVTLAPVEYQILNERLDRLEGKD